MPALAFRKPRVRKPGANPRQFVLNGHIQVPATFADFDAFREWCRSDAYPERGDVFWIDGSIWVDEAMEDFSTHNLVKTEIGGVLWALVKTFELGYFFTDRMRLVNEETELSVEPDLMFVSKQSLRDGRVRLPANERNRRLEVVGSPDMVLEVRSDSSGTKDELLREKYFAAGILEFWVVDVRDGRFKFDVLRRGPKGFSATPNRNGFLRSRVFDRSFQLSKGEDDLGFPTFSLEVEGASR